MVADLTRHTNPTTIAQLVNLGGRTLEILPLNLRVVKDRTNKAAVLDSRNATFCEDT
jgi:hypothetical protein